MKNAGTLEVVNEKDETYYLIKGFRPALLISRLVPNSWISERGASKIVANLLNTKYVKMLMSEFPLEIKTPQLWKNNLEKLSTNEQIEEKLETLSEAQPDSKKFLGELRPFQKKGLDFLIKTSGNALLADEMGLGKTIETLAFIATTKKIFPVVVVAPLITLHNWKNEINKFLRTTIKGALFENVMITPRVTIIRDGKQHELTDAEFFLINYELVNKRKDDLVKKNPKLVVFDEIQNLRSIGTDKYEGARFLSECPSIDFRIGLSGTPIYNRGGEVWGIVDVIQKGLLGSYQDFTQSFCAKYGDNYSVIASKQEALGEILQKRFMLRRKKIDVLKDLPEKNRFKQEISIDENYYHNEIEKMFANIQEAKSKLSTVTSDAELKSKVFELTAEYTKSIHLERQIAGISKAPYVAEYIKDLMELDEKIVVFCHHIAVHDILKRSLWEYKPLQIIGGQSDDFRNDQINLFQNDPEYKLIICGIRAGGLGINLTAGSYVIFAELDWSPPVHRQAEDRLHRIGQKKPVFAHYLIGKNTLDKRISRILTDKALEIDTILGDEQEKFDQAKSKDVLEELFANVTSHKSKLTEMLNV